MSNPKVPYITVSTSEEQNGDVVAVASLRNVSQWGSLARIQGHSDISVQLSDGLTPEAWAYAFGQSCHRLVKKYAEYVETTRVILSDLGLVRVPRPGNEPLPVCLVPDIRYGSQDWRIVSHSVQGPYLEKPLTARYRIEQRFVAEGPQSIIRGQEVAVKDLERRLIEYEQHVSGVLAFLEEKYL